MSSRNKKRETDVELNITTFMNLMVVLIPFLLLDAVFTQMSILQLTLPSSDAAPATPQENLKPFTLEVLLYKNRYELVDRKSESVLAVIQNLPDGAHDTAKLHDVLLKLKARATGVGQDVRDITILCEKDTPYVLLIQTMDTVRVSDSMLNGTMIKKELFPDISIGTAPADASGAAAGGAV
jgi:biopolymer transport protein ExbD